MYERAEKAARSYAFLLIFLLQLVFYYKQAVVLCNAVGAAGRSGFNLSCVQRHGKVGYCGILGFSRAVRDNRRIAVFARQLHNVKRFRKGAYLIKLYKY